MAFLWFCCGHSLAVLRLRGAGVTYCSAAGVIAAAASVTTKRKYHRPKIHALLPFSSEALAQSYTLCVCSGKGAWRPAHHVEASPLFGQVIQFYSCSSAIRPKTKEFATLIHADLQNNGVRCRFSPHHTKIGDKILDAIRRLAQLLHAWPLGHAIGC